MKKKVYAVALNGRGGLVGGGGFAPCPGDTWQGLERDLVVTTAGAGRDSRHLLSRGQTSCNAQDSPTRRITQPPSLRTPVSSSAVGYLPAVTEMLSIHVVSHGSHSHVWLLSTQNVKFKCCSIN